MTLLVPVGTNKTWIALAKLFVRDIGVDLASKQHFHILFRMKTAVRCKFGCLKDIVIPTKGLEIDTSSLDHWLEQIMLLCFANASA